MSPRRPPAWQLLLTRKFHSGRILLTIWPPEASASLTRSQLDMPRSAAGSGGQSVTQSEPLLCERSGLTRVFVQQRIWKIILKPGLRSVVEEHGVRGNRAGPGRQTPPKTRRPDRLSRIQIRQGVTPHVLFGVGASSCSSRPPATISLWSSQQRSSGLPLSFADWM